MSPVADCNLRDYLHRAEASTEPFFAIRIREWFGCLATAVQYLHANQIRHRDIKPANILVHGANVLLVDLELALDWKDLEQSTTTAYCGNTPLYAAPEVIERRKCNSATDIWSLGCVFLEMATVIKGKSISALQEYFHSQTKSNLFYHNPIGISGWISLLANVSAEDNEPLLWIPNMLQPDRTIRARATAIVNQIRASHTGTSRPNPYFGQCCQQDHESADLHIPLCLLCGVKILKV
jgi:serine/threonine protein kinase